MRYPYIPDLRNAWIWELAMLLINYSVGVATLSAGSSIVSIRTLGDGLLSIIPVYEKQSGHSKLFHCILHVCSQVVSIKWACTVVFQCKLVAITYMFVPNTCHYRGSQAVLEPFNHRETTCSPYINLSFLAKWANNISKGCFTLPLVFTQTWIQDVHNFSSVFDASVYRWILSIIVFLRHYRNGIDTKKATPLAATMRWSQTTKDATFSSAGISISLLLCYRTFLKHYIIVWHTCTYMWYLSTFSANT